MSTTYGIPYLGSKNSIVKNLIEFLPPAENFYDLFGGGACVSHYVAATQTHKYQNVYYNEIKSDVTGLIQDAIAGKYSYENFKPEFITRETFFKNKNTCAYTRLIWSFGNNQKDYLFSREIEARKHSLHNAVVFEAFDSIATELLDFQQWPESLNEIKSRRLFIGKKVREKKEKRADLQQLEQLERLQQLERLERLHLSSLDYSEVPIKDNSIIYCDIPYKNTQGYNQSFDYERFFNWADAQPHPLFISEYNIEDSRFTEVWSKEKRQRLSANAKDGKRKVFIEKLYANKAAVELLERK